MGGRRGREGGCWDIEGWAGYHGLRRGVMVWMTVRYNDGGVSAIAR